MFKSKSLWVQIYEPKNKKSDDGTKICVARWTRHFLQAQCDIWIKELAPSVELLTDWKDKKISWWDYIKRYREEMSNPEVIKILQDLKVRSNGGETITFLCHEMDDSFCHRRLLIKIINEL